MALVARMAALQAAQRLLIPKASERESANRQRAQCLPRALVAWEGWLLEREEHRTSHFSHDSVATKTGRILFFPPTPLPAPAAPAAPTAGSTPTLFSLPTPLPPPFVCGCRCGASVTIPLRCTFFLNFMYQYTCMMGMKLAAIRMNSPTYLR
jgi:hypothetical protein